jgi:hypothetical protein
MASLLPLRVSLVRSLQVGLHVALEPPDSRRPPSGCGHGLVVVDLGVDADPVLGEVDADGLVGQGALPDVGAEVPDPGMLRSSLLTAS